MEEEEPNARIFPTMRMHQHHVCVNREQREQKHKYQEQQKHNVELLHFALAKLPELQREALTMFEITGFSIKEIAIISRCGHC